MGGVLIEDGRVLLIRRGKEPLRGRWVIPGGTVELGETLEEGLIREMAEETGLVVRVGEVLTIFDRIQEENGRVLYHYVIVDYRCERVSGIARAGSDAESVAWASLGELGDYDLPQKAEEVIREAFRRVAGKGSAERLLSDKKPGTISGSF